MPASFDTDGTLFEALRPRLTAISRRIVGSEADAEDVVQDCWLKWQVSDQADLATPAAWLTTVVQHQSIDRLRRRTREELATHASLDLVPEALSASPEDDALRRAASGEALARLLACLSPAERMALVLREVFECEHADIAAALGTKPANARQHLARARRRLLAHREDAPEEKLCRELVLRFQAAINGLDLPAIVTLLGGEQPVSVHGMPQPWLRGGACANDALYALALAA